MSTVSIDLAREGFRRARDHSEKVYEAGQLLARAAQGRPFAADTLREAFTTSDFPALLNDGLNTKAITAYRDTPKEFEDVLFDVTVEDFHRRKLVDLWGATAFERVLEGEEYKGGPFETTEIEHGLGKFGRAYGVTWELWLSRRFHELADFPRALVQGAVKAQNKAVADVLVQGGAWNPEFFETVSNLPLTADNLRQAIDELAIRENHRGDLVDVSDLYLVHGPALRAQVTDMLVNLSEIEVKTSGGSRSSTVKITNPFRNVVKPLESRAIGTALGTSQSTAWALVQGKSSDLPSLIRTNLQGHPEVDIRVKKDQGQYVGGGDVPVEQGSFKDDTTWFRGRSVLGIDAGFTPGVWASAGA